MVKKSDLSGYRILVLAILVSLGWHLFWLSAVKVVSSPGRAQPVKFSKVSFLGPILTRVGMEVRVQPAVRSLLEKRFIHAVAREPVLPAREPESPDARRSREESGERQIDERMPYFIDKAVDSPKLEPDFGSD